MTGTETADDGETAQPKKKRGSSIAIDAVSNLIAGVIAVAVLTFALPGLLKQPIRTTTLQGQQQLTNSQIALLRAEAEKLRQDVDLLRLAQGEPGATSVVKPSVQLAALSKQLDELAQRQSRLEQALERDPAKAVELPLLRRDIEAVRESSTQNIASLKQAVDNIYDLNKWLLGSLAVGVLSLVINNIFGKKA